jgi:hypothetical protein
MLTDLPKEASSTAQRNDVNVESKLSPSTFFDGDLQVTIHSCIMNTSPAISQRLARTLLSPANLFSEKTENYFSGGFSGLAFA